MADPVPPTPTVPIPPDMGNTISQMSSMANIGTMMGDIFTKVTLSIANLGGTIESLVSKFSGLGQVQSTIAAETSKQSLLSAGLSTAVLGVGNSFDKLGNSAKSIQSVSEQFGQLKNVSQFSVDAIKKVSAAFNIDIVGKAPEAILGMIEKAAASADQFGKLKTSYLETQGASGGLSASWNKSGNSLAGLNEMVKQHSIYLNTIGRATGNSTAEMASHWNALASAIPGAADTQITAVEGSNKSTSGLVAAMRLASGTGQDFATITNNLTQAWSAYGLEGKDALAFTAQIYEVNDKLGLKLSTTKSFIDSNATAFAGLTDKGNNAVNVLNNMYDSFRKTGLSANESTTIIGKMTSGLKDLTLGQKAFLSAQSGGPGGLRGAIQIEQQIRSGDIEGVLKKAEASLKKQFGGKIVTQEEAGKSDVAAATFVKQREMLKSGAFGIKATDDNQATRILEAFKNGTSATVALKDEQSSLNDSMNRGEQLQSEGNTIMNSIARNTEALQLLNNATMFDANQQYLGSSERNDRPEFARDNATALRAGQDSAMMRTADHARHENSQKTYLGKDSKNSDLPEQAVNDKNAKSRYEGEMAAILKNFLPDVMKLSKSDQMRFDNIKVKLENKDTKIQELGRKELQELANSLSKGKESTDREKVFGSLSKLVTDQATGRGNQVGTAAVGSARAQAPAFAAQNQAAATRTANQGQSNNKHTTEHTVDVTVRGLCIDCGRPVQPDAHSQARTDGASGTK